MPTYAMTVKRDLPAFGLLRGDVLLVEEGEPDPVVIHRPLLGSGSPHAAAGTALWLLVSGEVTTGETPEAVKAMREALERMAGGESKAPSDTSSDGYRDPYDDGYEERHPDDPMAYGDRWKWEQSSNPPKRFTRAATEADVDAALARMKDHTPPPAEPNACRFYPDRMERGRFLVKYYRIVNR